jgi:hypothetical protein
MARLNIGASQMEDGGSADDRTVTDELPQRTYTELRRCESSRPFCNR